MKHLQISEQKAKELYPTASTEFKVLLEETFGKDFFKVSIMDRVKSFEDAYAIRNRGAHFIGFSVGVSANTQAFEKLKIITEVLNEGKEGKWYPYFYTGTFRFDDSLHTSSPYYPRKLLLATKELSDYAGTQFIELYKDYLL